MIRGERTVDLERLGEVAEPHGCADDGVDNVDVGADGLVCGRFGQRLHGELQADLSGKMEVLILEVERLVMAKPRRNRPESVFMAPS